MLIFYLVLFLTLAVFMLSIGLKVLLKKKPIFIHTRWLLILAAFAFSPMAINSIVLLIKIQFIYCSFIFNYLYLFEIKKHV